MLHTAANTKKQNFMTQVSIKEVAKIAGVSTATVSRCINESDRVKERTRIRVQDAILKTGYVPNNLAQSFRRGKTQVVMVVLPSIGDPFFAELIRGIRTVAMAKGYSLMISETQFNTITADEIGTMIVSRQADGIILLACMSPYGTEVLSAKSHKALPIVIGCETIALELTKFPGIHIDNIAAAKEATNYLLSLGHKKIAFICGQGNSLLTKDRELGYRAAMKTAKVAVDENWVKAGEMNIDGAIRATRELLLSPNKPTAIFCANDEMALAAMHETRANGLRIPEDISVVGFDDIRYAEIADPPLTTIAQPAEEIGGRTMYRLCKAIEEGVEDSPEPEIVPHQLIVRQSTGPVRGSS